MSATTNQRGRAAAPRYETKWRVSIGPPLDYVNHTLFTTGQPVTRPPITRTTEEVTIQANYSSPYVFVLDTTGYPTSGSVTLKFIIDGQRHATTFSYASTTLTAFVDTRFVRGYEGQIPVGAEASVWVDISERVTQVSGSQSWSGNLVDWEFALSGVGFNSLLMPRDAAVMIEANFTPNGRFGDWTDWVLMAQGYVRQWEVQGDARRKRRWSASVKSITTYMTNHRVPATRFGEENMAAGASVTASPHLVNSYLELREFGGGAGSTDADNLIDGKRNTVYISSDVPTLDKEVEVGTGGREDPLINEVGIWYGADFPTALQWIVIRLPRDAGGETGDDPDGEGRGKLYRQGLSIGNYVLTYSGTDYRSPFWPTYPKEVGGCRNTSSGSDCSGNYIRLPDVTLSENNPVIILTSNAEAFRAYYSVESGVAVYDWRFLPGFADDGMSGANVLLNRAGEVLHLRLTGNNVKQVARDMVAWGDPEEFDNHFYSGDHDDESQWNDPFTVPVPADGSSIRRVGCGDSNKEVDWIEEDDPLPGTTRSSNDGVYASVELPPFDCRLVANIGPTDTTFRVTSTRHLDRVGVMRLDGEHIAYELGVAGGLAVPGTVNVTQRGANGTTPASHTTAALIYQIDDELGATRLPKVDKIRWKRARRYFTSGTGTFGPVTPDVWEIWGSVAETPGYPGDTDWRTLWLTQMALHSVDSRAKVSPLDVTISMGSRRLARAMMRIRRMSDYGVEGQSGRGKLNELEVLAPAEVDIPNDEEGVGRVLRHLLESFPPLTREMIALDPQAFTGTSGNLEISEGGLLPLVLNICERHGMVMDVGRDNRIRITRNPFHPRGPRPEITAAFTPEMIRGTVAVPTTTYPSRLLSGVGQIIVTIDDRAAQEVYEGRYPPNAGPGRIERRTLEASAQGAQEATHYAAALFIGQPENSRRFRFTTVGPCEWAQALQRGVVFDYSDDAARLRRIITLPDGTVQEQVTEGRYVNGLIVGVEWNMNGIAVIDAQEWQMML